jgi:hypothetical protein
MKPETLPLLLEPGQSTAKSPEAEVFEYWLVGWKRIVKGTRPPILDQKRRGKIRARLAEKYTVADLKRAVDGLWSASWYIENKRYDLELVCRDAAHVDRFLAEAEKSTVGSDAPTEPAKVYGPPVDPPPGVRERLEAILSEQPGSSPLEARGEASRPTLAADVTDAGDAARTAYEDRRRKARLAVLSVAEHWPDPEARAEAAARYERDYQRPYTADLSASAEP